MPGPSAQGEPSQVPRLPALAGTQAASGGPPLLTGGKGEDLPPAGFLPPSSIAAARCEEGGVNFSLIA